MTFFLAPGLEFNALGRTAGRTPDRHARDLIEAVLFTAPGERVNRPDFGAGAGRLVFEPNRFDLAAATQLLIQGGLQQFLGGVISVENVTVTADEHVLRIHVDYVNLLDGQTGQADFERKRA